MTKKADPTYIYLVLIVAAAFYAFFFESIAANIYELSLTTHVDMSSSTTSSSTSSRISRPDRHHRRDRTCRQSDKGQGRHSSLVRAIQLRAEYLSRQPLA